MDQHLRYFKIVIFESVTDCIIKESEPMPKYLADRFSYLLEDCLEEWFSNKIYHIEKQEVIAF